MRVSLNRTRERARKEISQLRSVLADMPVTAPSRYALAEIALIRLAGVLERSIAELAYKVACGAEYGDGGREECVVTCRSLDHARQLMLSENGQKDPPRQFLKWTRAAYIAESVKSVIPNDGHFLTVCRNFGPNISEIFEIRHYIAHRNASSRRGYMKWVRQMYGQERRVQVGYFLTTLNLRPHSNIDRYLRSAELILDNLCKEAV